MPLHLSPTRAVDWERVELSLDLHLLLFAMEYTRRRRGVAGIESRDGDDLCGLHGPAGAFEAPICSPHPLCGLLYATHCILEEIQLVMVAALITTIVRVKLVVVVNSMW
jgi:hypothetical protein